MAFVPGITEEEEKEQNGMDIISSAQGAGIAGAGGPAAGPTTGQARGGRGSGQFTNIQEYIAANVPKTQQLAKGITGAATKEATGLREQLGQQRQRFLGPGGEFGEQQKEFIQQQVQQAGQQPQVQADVERFRGFATGATQTPELGEERRQAADLERRAKEFETPAGRFEGLQRLVGGQAPTYGRGQRRLDQLLLAGDRPSRLQSIRDIRQTTAGLGEQVGGLQSDIAAARQARQQEAITGVGEARTGLAGQLETRYGRLQTGLEAGQLSQEDLSRLGLEAGQRTYGADVLGALGATRGTTQAELARLDALAQLGGLEGREAFQGVAGDAGQDIASVIAQQKAEYERLIDPIGKAETDYLSKRQQVEQGGFENIKSYLGRVSQMERAYLEHQRQQARLPGLEQQFGGFAPQQVRDGGVIDPRMAALKKMRGY